MDARQPESRPTPTMREKLARAVAGWGSGPAGLCTSEWDALPDGNGKYWEDGLWRGDCLEIVDAILNVLRENAPSLHHEDDCVVVHELRGAPDDIWKHMIDTIINEGRG